MNARSCEGLTLRLDYQHRWLGTIIEDGAADPTGTYVLANPGHVPQSAIDSARRDAESANAAAEAYRATNMMSDPVLDSVAANANAKLTTLEGLKNAPKPDAHLRRHHGLGEQAVHEELAGARLVHVLAPGG